jgi:cathepsin L
MKVVLAISILASVICVCLSAGSDDKFKEFQRSRNRKYKNEAEERQRFQNFEKNSEIVEQHNEKFRKGQVTYKLALNSLSDLTHAEVVSKYTGYVPPEL